MDEELRHKCKFGGNKDKKMLPTIKNMLTSNSASVPLAQLCLAVTSQRAPFGTLRIYRMGEWIGGMKGHRLFNIQMNWLVQYWMRLDQL